MQSQYRLPEYAHEIDVGVFYYKHYGNCVFYSYLTWDPEKIIDLIHFDHTKNNKELHKELWI